MLQHERQKVQSGNLRMCHKLRIGPIKCVFDTLWRHLETTLRIELEKAREPMHARRIQGATEVKQHRIHTGEVHTQSLSSSVRLPQRCTRANAQQPGASTDVTGVGRGVIGGGTCGRKRDTNVRLVCRVLRGAPKACDTKRAQPRAHPGSQLLWRLLARRSATVKSSKG